MMGRREFSTAFLMAAVFAGASACNGSPTVANPSFETGDLSGWACTDFAIVTGTASDGQYSLKPTPEWREVPREQFGQVWQWESSLSQTLNMSPGDTRFSLDVRGPVDRSLVLWMSLGILGGDLTKLGALLLVDGSETGSILVDAPVTVSQAPNGFTGYSYDLSSAMAYISPSGGDVVFSFSISDISTIEQVGQPAIDFYIDNVQLTPEPATLCMLAIGTLAMRRRK